MDGLDGLSGWVNEWMDWMVSVGGWMDGWMDEWMDGWMVSVGGWMDDEF